MKRQIYKVLIEVLLSVSVLLPVQSQSQALSPNGYSGIGLVPSASSVNKGNAILSFDPTVPGATSPSGFNTQVGFGLTEELELIGRLATNDQKCNMFILGACPPNTIRDFSSSIKWSLPLNWLKQNDSAIAIGATDFGGAATYFRSYYVVGSKSLGQLDFSLGRAKAQVPTSMLHGTLASVSWRPNDWSNLSIQKVGPHATAHALIQKQILPNGVNAWLTLNHRITEEPIVQKNWVGWGVSMPLDQVQTKSNPTKIYKSTNNRETKELEKIKLSSLVKALNDKGFYNVRLGYSLNNKLVIELENTAYQWNTLDAAGVALGVISSAFTTEAKEQAFDLILTSRGIKQLKVTGEALCVGRWLSKGEVCEKLIARSLLQNSQDAQHMSSNLKQIFGGMDESVEWSSGEVWNFRPEIIVSPVLISAIGTEFGSLDVEIGANLNVVLPLWPGATIEKNRIEPLGVGTRQFEQGGVFYGSRLKPVTNRKLFHQLINLPVLNTQTRLSFGTAYADWSGRQIETSTQSTTGRHKFGLMSGAFKNDSIAINNEKNYDLLNYRFTNNDQQTAVSEITYGKFWGGDRGFSINQRFWFGDTTLNAFFRRSRMAENQPLVSFAGLQLAIPFTPRENKSLEHVGIRGSSQWTYSLETKVLDKDNIITGGFGEVPRIGDSLITTFNRDRNSNRYYDTNLARIRNAYLYLANN
jgi:hypothetical protein